MPYLNANEWSVVKAALQSGRDFFGGADVGEINTALGLIDKAESFVASPGLRELANDLYGTDEVEIDDEQVGTSPSDDGTWVQAWVWVSREEMIEAGLIDEEDSDADDA